MYHNIKDYYKINENSEAYGKSYKHIVAESDATSIEYPSENNLTEGKYNYKKYAILFENFMLTRFFFFIQPY